MISVVVGPDRLELSPEILEISVLTFTLETDILNKLALPRHTTWRFCLHVLAQGRIERPA